MGLQIKTYSYSYSRLHQLRQMALNYENINIPIDKFYFQNEVGTKFRQFICHSDCDGIYVSKASKQYDKLKIKWESIDKFMFGDLDELKEEVKILKDYMLSNLNEWDKTAWIKFYNDVISSRKILEFM